MSSTRRRLQGAAGRLPTPAEHTKTYQELLPCRGSRRRGLDQGADLSRGRLTAAPDVAEVQPTGFCMGTVPLKQRSRPSGSVPLPCIERPGIARPGPSTCPRCGNGASCILSACPPARLLNGRSLSEVACRHPLRLHASTRQHITEPLAVDGSGARAASIWGLGDPAPLGQRGGVVAITLHHVHVAEHRIRLQLLDDLPALLLVLVVGSLPREARRGCSSARGRGLAPNPPAHGARWNQGDATRTTPHCLRTDALGQRLHPIAGALPLSASGG